MARSVLIGRRTRWGLAAVVLLILVLGHLIFWYWPRLRPVDPSTSPLAVQALSQARYPVGLWVPYPHQNLGVLASHGGDLPGIAADLALLADAPPPRWLSFGPFSVPPSRELAVLADPEAGKAIAVIRVYPLFAALARVSGTVARNPWLRGGVIPGQKGRIEVRWEGTRWLAAALPQSAPEGSFPDLSFLDAATEDSLPTTAGSPRERFGALRLDDSRTFLPAGVYGLYRQEEDWVLGREGALGWKGQTAETRKRGRKPPPDPVEALEDLLVGAVSLVAVGQGGDGVELGEGQRGVVLFEGSEDAQTPPGFAVLNSHSSRRLPLAGLGLAALLGSESHSGRASGWSVLASSERNFLRSAFMASDLVRMTDAWATVPGARIHWVAAARPGGIVEVLDALDRALASSGPGMASEQRKVEALARLLRPLAAFPRATLILGEAPGRAELRVIAAR